MMPYIGFGFRVPGLVESKGSWVGVGRGRMRRDNPRSKAWEETVAWHAKLAMQQVGVKLVAAGKYVEVYITFWLPPAVGKKNKRDVDKVARAILDAMTGIAYADDEQVEELTIKRHRHPHDEGWIGAMINVYEIKER